MVQLEADTTLLDLRRPSYRPSAVDECQQSAHSWPKEMQGYLEQIVWIAATNSKAEQHSILQLDIAGQTEPPFDRMHIRSKTPDGDEVGLFICEVFKVHTKRTSKGYWIVF